MNKKELLKISNLLLFDANEQVIKEIEDLYLDLEKNIEIMKTINTDDVEPMIYVDSSPITFLRDDIESEEIMNVKDILKNSPTSHGDLIKIKNKGAFND